MPIPTSGHTLATTGPCKKDFSVSRFLCQLVVGFCIKISVSRFCIKISVAASSGWIHNSDKQIDLSGKCKLNLATLWSLADPPTGLPQRSILEKNMLLFSHFYSVLNLNSWDRQWPINCGDNNMPSCFPSIFTFVLLFFTFILLLHFYFHFHIFLFMIFLYFHFHTCLFHAFPPFSFSLSCFSFSPEYSHFPPCTSER